MTPDAGAGGDAATGAAGAGGGGGAGISCNDSPDFLAAAADSCADATGCSRSAAMVGAAAAGLACSMGADSTIGAGCGSAAGSIMRIDRFSSVLATSACMAGCAVPGGGTGIGNGRRRHARPTASSRDAASEAGAIHPIRGRAGRCVARGGCNDSRAAARIRASRSGPGSLRPCRRGKALANARSSASSGCGGCGGRWFMPGASRAVCPWHNAGVTSQSRGQRR